MITLVLLTVVGGLVVVLLLPVSLQATGTAGDDVLWGAAELRWGYHIAVVRLGPDGGGRFYLCGIPVSLVSRRRKDKKARKKQKTRRKHGDAPRWRHLGRHRRVLVRMAIRGLRAFHPRLHIRGTVGLGDPARTAVMLTSVRHIERRVGARIELDIRDDFLERTTHLFGRARAWLLPAEAVLILGVWIVQPDTRRALRELTR